MKSGPRAQFERAIFAGLKFWRRQTEKQADLDLHALDLERQNLYRAVQFGLELPEAWTLTAEVALQSIPLVNRRMYWGEWVPVLEALIERAPADSGGSKFRLYIQLGRCQRMLRQLEEATSTHQAAVALARELGDDLTLAEAYYNAGRDYMVRRQYGESVQYSQDALALLSEDNPAHLALIAHLHNTLAVCAQRQGELDEAEALQSQAVAIWRSQGDDTHLARALIDFAVILRSIGHFEEAIASYREAYRLLGQTANKLDQTIVKVNLGVVYFSQGAWEKAEETFRKVDLDYLRRSGNVTYQARALSNLGNVLLKQQRWTEAGAYIHQAIGLFEQQDNRLELANALGTMGEIMNGRGEPGAATSYLDQALLLLDEYPEEARARKLRGIFEGERDKINRLEAV